MCGVFFLDTFMFKWYYAQYCPQKLCVASAAVVENAIKCLLDDPVTPFT